MSRTSLACVFFSFFFVHYPSLPWSPHQKKNFSRQLDVLYAIVLNNGIPCLLEQEFCFQCICISEEIAKFGCRGLKISGLHIFSGTHSLTSNLARPLHIRLYPALRLLVSVVIGYLLCKVADADEKRTMHCVVGAFLLSVKASLGYTLTQMCTSTRYLGVRIEREDKVQT